MLVCTTIVETGLDISNANTLIVERMPRCSGCPRCTSCAAGSAAAASAATPTSCTRRSTPLTETAHDRLATIAQNSELGAGMAVAMKDLEIRGAGNILGAEQSGHIAGVGFDLYIRLVGEAVTAFQNGRGRGEGDEEETWPRCGSTCPVDAHIPHDYVAGERLRLEAYRKIAEAADQRRARRDRRGADRPLRRAADAGAQPARGRRVPAAVPGARASPRSRSRATAIRIAPLELPDSAQLRLRRLYPKAQYKPAARLVTVPRPVEGGRIGGAPLRDVALLDWCAALIGDVLAPIAAGR